MREKSLYIIKKSINSKVFIVPFIIIGAFIFKQGHGEFPAVYSLRMGLYDPKIGSVEMEARIMTRIVLAANEHEPTLRNGSRLSCCVYVFRLIVR